MTLESALLSALSLVTGALVWAVKLLYVRLQKAEEHVVELRLTVETLQHENGAHSAKVEMFERCPAPACPFHKQRLASFGLLLFAMFLTSCAGFGEREVTKVDGSKSTTRFGVLIGTDADDFSPPGWSIKGVKQAETAGKAVKGAVTRAAIDAFAPAATGLTNSVGNALENVSKP
jgi:hypothetical protein